MNVLFLSIRTQDTTTTEDTVASVKNTSYQKCFDVIVVRISLEEKPDTIEMQNQKGDCSKMNKNYFLYSKHSTRYGMSERLVEIPVSKIVREKIKHVKGVLTYDEFLAKIVGVKK